jgi:two-component system sensor histidine kinase PilS (NtrC family)
MPIASAPPTADTRAREDTATAYPLSAALTRRVINYLGFFRLFISLALGLAFLTGGLAKGPAFAHPAAAIALLGVYVLLSVYLFAISRRAGINCFHLARNTSFVDVLFLSLLFIAFGGLDSGLGVLLIFVCASGAIMLPLRMALFLAAIATLAFIGETSVRSLLNTVAVENLLSAGFYGLTTFLTSTLTHVLAFWMRDYRLIAERQRRTLTRLEQINELIIRRMRNGVLAVDHQGEIQMMNESAWFLLGSPAATDRLLAEVSPELSAAMESWRESPTGDTRPVTLAASQARVVPKFVSLPGEEEIRTLVFLEDNDVVAQRAMELSANSLAKLSGSIAHEIRNPLAAVSHAAQLLGESQDIKETDARLLTIIRNQSRRMNGIVENILQLSRREKSRPELFELTQWLRDLYQEFGHAITSRECKLDLVVPEEELLVMFDRSQLHQALWKLMENAVEHAGGESDPGEVTLRMQRQVDTGYCLISVEDNGPGIPADQVGNIFEPFFTTRQQGSGLGLYIARQLCEANQAELTVDSTPGCRTRFHIRLPVARIETDREVQA